MNNRFGCVVFVAGVLALANGVAAAQEALHLNRFAPDVVAPSPHVAPATRQVSEQVIGELPEGMYILSPDGRRTASIVTMADPAENRTTAQAAVIVDGKLGKSFGKPYAGRNGWEAYDPPIKSLTFSPDSKRFAYLAVDRGSGLCSVTVDGVQGKEYGSATAPVFSPHGRHVVYTASERHGNPPFFLVTDGQEGKPYESVIGFTYSPDGKRTAYVAQPLHSHKYCAVVDGQEGAAYEGIHPSQPSRIVFSPDSTRFAYIAAIGRHDARAQNEFAVVADGQEGRHYRRIHGLAFSPDSKHLLYVAEIMPGHWSVVVDGNEGKRYAAWRISSPVFSPDSKRVAYTVNTNLGAGDAFVVVDGQEGTRYSGQGIAIPKVSFSPDSRHVAYIVMTKGRDEEMFVVRDGKEGKHYLHVGRMCYSPDSAQLAYVARAPYAFPKQPDRASGRLAVWNENEGTQYDYVEDLVFSPDGKYLAYIAYNKQSQKSVVVVNGQEGKAYDGILSRDTYYGPESRPVALVFDSPNELSYVARKGRRLILVQERLDAAASDPEAR